MPPMALNNKDEISWEILKDSPNVSIESKPIFFGHYWLEPHAPKEPLAKNICCLDFSAGKLGPLVAYRHDSSDREVIKERFLY
jgi:hypothetical protein